MIPALDKTLPTIASCLDTTLRQIGQAPTYALTDNERTVTDPLSSSVVAGQ